VTGGDDLAVVEAALVEHFGQQPTRASVSFVGVEPIEILRFEPVPGQRAYLTLGMSRHPMTEATQAVMAEDGPRGELMLEVRDPIDAFADVWRRLAVLAAAPVVDAVVYRPGMTVDLGEPIVPGSRCTGVMVSESVLAAVETPSGPVEVFDVRPATATELAWCRVRGAPALRERWTSARTDLLDLGRAAVSLDEQ
jgi:suppressor of fused protein SUFU